MFAVALVRIKRAAVSSAKDEIKLGGVGGRGIRIDHALDQDLQTGRLDRAVRATRGARSDSFRQVAVVIVIDIGVCVFAARRDEIWAAGVAQQIGFVLRHDAVRVGGHRLHRMVRKVSREGAQVHNHMGTDIAVAAAVAALASSVVPRIGVAYAL